ncbi:hypothetical protein D0U04_05145 [Bacillus clarus]|uniref:Uncharacterized protein n=1 Tax=Bacillus clarus TaxID=2338372 RepID=A0ABX9KZW4_9BACI|nr:hypothetical protein D0U04_05145 [Bacillus clarus]
MRNSKEAGRNQLLYPALTGSKTPASKLDECEEVGRESSDCPLKPNWCRLIKVSLYPEGGSLCIK